MERLRTAYSGNRDRVSNPNQFRKGSGSILRKALQQLEAEGFVEKVKGGRQVSAKGQSFIDGVAHSLREAATKATPALAQIQMHVRDTDG